MTSIAELGVVVRSQGLKQTARDLDAFDKSAFKAETSVNSLKRTASRAFAALAATGIAYGATRSLLDNAKAYENLSVRMGLYLKNQSQLVKAQAQIFQMSQQAGTALADTAELYTKLAGASEELRNDQTKLLRVVDLFSKGLVVSGADAAAAAASTRQFAQALASGTLRGDEFVSVMEGAPRVAKALADGLGVPIGKLRELASQGKLTAEVVTEALLRGGKAIDVEFNKMPLTVDRAVQRVKNSYLQLIGQTNQASGATRGLAQAIDGLGNALGDPQTLAAFQATAQGLASVATNALRAIGALKEYYARPQEQSLPSLQNERKDLETKLFGMQRRSGQGLADSNDPIAKLLGLPSGLDAKIRATRAAIAELDREIASRNRRGDFIEGRVTSKSGTGRWANVTSDPGAKSALLDVGTGEVKEGKVAAAFRATETAAKDAAKALVDYTADEQAMIASSLSVESAKAQALVAFSRITAQMAGPLAAAEFEHIERMQEIARLGKDAGASADAIEDAQAREVAAYEATTAAMIEQLDAAADPRRVRLMDEFRDRAVDGLTDIATGAASAKDALKDFFDGLAQMAARAIAEQWIQKLFGAQGTTGNASAAGGTIWDTLGNLFGAYLGGGGAGGQAMASGGAWGRAIGGPVSKGGMYQVNERGPEMFEANGKQYLMPSSNGHVVPMREDRGRGGVNMTVNYSVQGRIDRRTESQIAATAGSAVNRALARKR